MIVDTHAHLYYGNLLEQIDGVIERAKSAGISKIIAPAVDVKSAKKILELSEKYDLVYGAVGFHPCDLKKLEMTDIKLIEKFASNNKVVAIGEIGLDYYWDSSEKEKQKRFFIEQIRLAKSLNLPVIIHTRDSLEDAIEIIRAENDGKLSGQFHCFSGNVKQVEEICEFGNFYFSFCGNITFKKYSGIAVIEKVPADKLLSETDSPFLSPEPYRGKVNEPLRVVHSIEFIAAVKGLNQNEMKKIMFENASKLFF